MKSYLNLDPKELVRLAKEHALTTGFEYKSYRILIGHDGEVIIKVILRFPGTKNSAGYSKFTYA